MLQCDSVHLDRHGIICRSNPKLVRRMPDCSNPTGGGGRYV